MIVKLSPKAYHDIYLNTLIEELSKFKGYKKNAIKIKIQDPTDIFEELNNFTTYQYDPTAKIKQTGFYLTINTPNPMGILKFFRFIELHGNKSDSIYSIIFDGVLDKIL